MESARSNHSASIQLHSQLSELVKLAQTVAAFGEANGLTMKEVFSLNLVLDELVTNIISYGYDGAGGKLIQIELRLDGQWIRAQLIDDAKPFDPLSMTPQRLDAALEDRTVGGLGIHLVRELMDEVDYRRVGGRNILSLAKRRTVSKR